MVFGPIMGVLGGWAQIIRGPCLPSRLPPWQHRYTRARSSYIECCTCWLSHTRWRCCCCRPCWHFASTTDGHRVKLDGDGSFYDVPCVVEVRPPAGKRRLLSGRGARAVDENVFAKQVTLPSGRRDGSVMGPFRAVNLHANGGLTKHLVTSSRIHTHTILNFDVSCLPLVNGPSWSRHS